MAAYEALVTVRSSREEVVRIWPQAERTFQVERISMRQGGSTFEIRDILVGLSSQMPVAGAPLYASTFGEGLPLRVDALPPRNALTFRVRNIGPRTGRLRITVEGDEIVASQTVAIASS